MRDSDRELVRQAQAGDGEAFGELVRRYSRAVYGLCWQQTGDAEEARDLAQETFVQAYRDLPQLREPEKFAPWLYQIARNRGRMWQRRQPERTLPWEELPELPDGAPSPAEQLERQERDATVRAALEQVSPDNREALTLHYLAGYSHQEIAAFIGVPVSTVKSRLHEGRQQLRRVLLEVVRESLRSQQLPEAFIEQTITECHRERCRCPQEL